MYMGTVIFKMDKTYKKMDNTSVCLNLFVVLDNKNVITMI